MGRLRDGSQRRRHRRGERAGTALQAGLPSSLVGCRSLRRSLGLPSDGSRAVSGRRRGRSTSAVRVLEATVESNGGRNLAAAEMLSMGGAIGRVGEEDTAYGHRDALVDFLAVAGCTDPAEDDDHMGAARRVWERVVGRGAYGVYVNNLGSEGQDRVHEAYGDAKYARLSKVKARYDADNVFRHNANIRPTRRRGCAACSRRRELLARRQEQKSCGAIEPSRAWPGSLGQEVTKRCPDPRPMGASRAFIVGQRRRAVVRAVLGPRCPHGTGGWRADDSYAVTKRCAARISRNSRS